MGKRQAVNVGGVSEHLATFDDLDFNQFSGQNWEGFHKSHSDDITVYWPDGHSTQGLKKHVEDMKYMFSFAPDTRIKTHPVKLGQGNWTAVIGVMEGTFTKPMVTPDGKTIQPTHKPFRLNMCTVGHWKDGLMDEEYLFWDNQTYMKQMGLA
ncbi:MAG: ester cyclase [Oligoflexia bacterium]|nr:ester cyclase [Oligoflexia bacterium]